MTFWSGERLRIELPKLIDEYDKNNIDCASYRLHIGPEIYVTPSDGEGDWNKRKKIQLGMGETAIIPPGQFAFLLTEETVTVPENAIAWISMRSKHAKFRGLVNVSGFHVDPGYKGRLIYSVFNAGPSPIHVARGNDWFVIFYADLDRMSNDTKKFQGGYKEISTDIINPIAQEVLSLATLNSKIADVERKLYDRIQVVERDSAVSRWAAALLIGAIIAFGVRECAGPSSQRAAATAPVVGNVVQTESVAP